MRRSGKTTRIVDRCVQEYFTKGVTFIYDERGTNYQKHASMIALGIFNRRMVNEHNLHISVNYDAVYGEFDGVKCYKITKKL